MFRERSWIRRASVVIALLASFGAGMVSRPHTDGADDPACSPVVVAHDARAHHFAANPAPEQQHTDHCFLCHSLRSFHPAFEEFELYAPAPRAQHLQAASIRRVSTVEWTLVPGRAPPV
jgi:hypothetical protein